MVCFGACFGDSPVDDSIVVLIDATLPVGLEVDNLGKKKDAIVVDNVKPETVCAKVRARRTPPLCSPFPVTTRRCRAYDPPIGQAGIARNMIITKIDEEVLLPGLDIAAFGEKVRERDVGTASLLMCAHTCVTAQIKAAKAKGGKFSLTFAHLPPSPPEPQK